MTEKGEKNRVQERVIKREKERESVREKVDSVRERGEKTSVREGRKIKR